MNELNINPLGFSMLDMGQVSLALDSHIHNTIKTINWDAYPYLGSAEKHLTSRMYIIYNATF